MKRILGPVLGLVFGLGLSLLLVEVVVRLILHRPATGEQWNDRPLFYLKSPLTDTIQDFPYPAEKSPGVFRVAAIGDSFTFGPFMQFWDTYPKQLEHILNINGGAKAEVRNYAVPAYSTSHEIELAERALKDKADLILLQITLNDPELKPYRPTGIREDLPDKFGAMKLTGTIGSLANYWKTLQFVMQRLHNTRTHRAYVDYFTDLFENPKTWNPFVKSMTRLVNGAKEANVPIVAVVFPLFGLPLDDNYPFTPLHEKVSKLLESLSVPHLDISDHFKGIPLERLQVLPGKDRHPNEIAHRMAAEKIYLWLEQKSLIPEALRPRERFSSRIGTINQKPWTAPPGEGEPLSLRAEH